VTVRTYLAWETAATLSLLGGARGAGAPAGEERGGGISCRHAHSSFYMDMGVWDSKENADGFFLPHTHSSSSFQ